MERFGLRLHPQKTRLIAFERPASGQRGGKGPGTFEFLGFTLYWRRTRRGHWQMGCKTRGKGLRRFIETVGEWCRRHRHLPVQVQHAALTRRLVGHFRYFGVNGNYHSLARVVRAVQRIWLKWLRRRSQRTRLTWERYKRMLCRFPWRLYCLPKVDRPRGPRKTTPQQRILSYRGVISPTNARYSNGDCDAALPSCVMETGRMRAASG